MTTHIGEMNWREYHEKARHGTAPIFLPLGSLEQHGPHMSMNVDVLLPTAISALAAERVGGMVAPPITYGYKSQVKSGGGNHLPGTASLDGATLTAVIQDVICELARHGGRKIVVMNGHYENNMFLAEGVDLALRRLRGVAAHLRVMALSYWDFIDEETVARLYPNNSFPGWHLEHGGVLETSLMLYLHPELVDMSAAESHPPACFPPYDLFPPNPSWTPPSGTLSSPKQASREKGRIIADCALQGICAAIIKEFLSANKGAQHGKHQTH